VSAIEDVVVADDRAGGPVLESIARRSGAKRAIAVVLIQRAVGFDIAVVIKIIAAHAVAVEVV
jgi:hypothetical protein